jgi:two-component system phosphate regulon response regulator PhoB
MSGPENKQGRCAPLRVHVVDDSRNDALLAQRCLAAAGYEVRVDNDPEAGLAKIVRDQPDVVIVDWIKPKLTGLELAERIRMEEERIGHTYIVMLTSRVSPTDVSRAFAAGVDDYVRKPFVREELLARVAGVQRLKSVVRQAIQRAQRTWTQNPILALSAWKNIDSIVASELADMTTLPLSHLRKGPGPRPPQLCAKVMFSLAQERAEVPLIIGIDAQSLSAISSAMLGEPEFNEETLREIVLEMSNVLGGAFKRKAVDEGVVFATGLPREVPIADVRGSLDECEDARHWCVSTEGDEVVVEVWSGARRRENRMVRVADLVEGMVLASDVLNPAGVLLLPAGARLTETTAERARALLNPAFVIEVAAAA